MRLITKLECRKLRPFLWDYAAARLPEERMEQLEFHIARCSTCSKELAEYKSAQKLISGGRGNRLPEPTLDWAGLRAVLEELPPPVQMISQVQQKTPYRTGPLLWSAVGGTAAAVIMLLLAKPQPVNVHYHTVQAAPQKVAVLSVPKSTAVRKSRPSAPKTVTRIIEVRDNTQVAKQHSDRGSQSARLGFEDATLALIANITPPAKTFSKHYRDIKSPSHNINSPVARDHRQNTTINDLQQQATLVSASSDGGDAHYVMSALQPDPYGPDTPY